MYAVATDCWDHTVLRREQLDDNMGPFSWEVEAGECSEWMDIADLHPICESYWV
jgi:hypothetical protein